MPAELVVWLLVAVVVAGGALLRIEVVRAGPLPRLAAEEVTAQVRLELTGDPIVKEGRFSSYVLVRAAATRVAARGLTWRLHQPVLVIAPAGWRSLHLGETVRASGRLSPADGDDLGAVYLAHGEPEVLARDGPLLRGAAHVREGIRQSVAQRPSEPRALVPALVDGDDVGLPERTATDFRTAGLTHLLAVSGTNLTLVVGALLVLARAVGVRARGLVVAGALGVVGFVLLARPEPSVLRAAVMGSVALVGMGSNGRQRGPRALGLAVLVLMLFDPWLAGEVGFALSVLATAGIVFLAPGWRDALCRWLPRWAAEALSVPLAAQLACTPVVAAISGQVSLVAVVANLLAAPVVAPATVLGLGGGLLSSVWAPLGRPVGTAATWCADWVIAVAHRSAALPSAALGWPSGPVPLLVLTLVCGWLALVLGALLARRGWAVGTCGPAAGADAGAAADARVAAARAGCWWPATSVRATGWCSTPVTVRRSWSTPVPTRPSIDGCLRRLGVRRVPLVVLTHFHADHVDGLAGVLRGRRVGAIEVTGLAEPSGGAAEVSRLAARAGVPAARRVRGRAGPRSEPLRWQVLAPTGSTPPDSESPPNDASVVLLVESRGIRMLLMGDEETGSQERLAARVGSLHVDVLKVAHHGSARAGPRPGARAARPARGDLGGPAQRLRPSRAGHAAAAGAGRR